MDIELDHIIPVPLKDKILARQSDIWNRQVSWKQGAHIKIKAPSGTGKTTFIHILYRLRTDFEGSVKMDGTSLEKFDGNALATLRQQQLSVILQDLRLFPNLTARENIELKRVLQTPFYEASKIDEMAAALGVQHVLNQQAGLCSYGEQQRIAIIRSLIQPFQWLIMDEPFSHLDNNNATKAAALIAEECKKRNAGLLITDLEDDQHFTYSHQFNL